jgi:prolipoprotein diacylglyceryl transferase
VVLAAIPSPSTGVVHLGPLPLRGYAGAIILGIVVAVLLTERRMRSRGQPEGVVLDAALWAVPLGIIGARLYHIITNPEEFFGRDGDPARMIEVWKGGLGIWGAVAFGAFGVWYACRTHGIRFGTFADAAAPGVVIAQAIGRLGNYFNQELYGRPTTLPWGLKIDPAHYPLGHDYPPGTLFHPTFLYELIWDLLVGVILLAVDRRHRLGRGKLCILYVALYTLGRAGVEALRIDDAHRIFGVRLNDWVALIVFVVAVAALFLVRTPVDPPAPLGHEALAAAAADGGSGDGFEADGYRADQDRAHRDRADQDRVDQDRDDQDRADGRPADDEGDRALGGDPAPAAPAAPGADRPG